MYNLFLQTYSGYPFHVTRYSSCLSLVIRWLMILSTTYSLSSASSTSTISCFSSVELSESFLLYFFSNDTWNTGCIRFRLIQSFGKSSLYATGLTTCIILNGPVYLADNLCVIPDFNDRYLVDNNTSSPSLKINSLRCLLA